MNDYHRALITETAAYRVSEQKAYDLVSELAHTCDDAALATVLRSIASDEAHHIEICDRILSLLSSTGA